MQNNITLNHNEKISDVLKITMPVFNDERGTLKKLFTSKILPDFSTVDDVYSTISKNKVFRGFHHQMNNHSQGKIVSCHRGVMRDYALDLRPGSSTFGSVATFELNDAINEFVYIPKGFSHGMLSLANDTVTINLCCGDYIPMHEAGFHPFSVAPELISQNIILSEKDQNLERFDKCTLI